MILDFVYYVSTLTSAIVIFHVGSRLCEFLSEVAEQAEQPGLEVCVALYLNLPTPIVRF